MNEPTDSGETAKDSVSDQQRQSFEDAANADQMSLVEEFVLFLREHKAWWLVPILLALALIGVAVWLSSSAAAPFIYPLF